MQKPIDISQYYLFYAFDGVDDRFIQEAIKEYEEIVAAETNQTKVHFYTITQDFGKIGNWTLLFCYDSISFYHFHNLLGWIGDSKDEHGNSAKVYFGIAIHKYNPEQSFIVMPANDNPAKDLLYGVFKSNIQFSIYIPEAYLPEGNMMLDGYAEMPDTMDRLLKWRGLSQEFFEPKRYKDSKTILSGTFPLE